MRPTRFVLAACLSLAPVCPAVAAPAPAIDPAPGPTPAALRVCADPNNLPFSNERREGFEDRLAALVAKELGRPLAYVWRPQRRGFLRNGLNAGACDVVMALPTHSDMALTTRPYYRSTYVFVSRRDRKLQVASFDDPRLRTMRIGVQLIGDDFANAPPAHALARRGLAQNLVGYTVYGDYSQPDPPAEIVRAVVRGEVDLAVAWGPLAGFVATRGRVPLTLKTAVGATDDPPMGFDISMAVKRGNSALLAELEAIIERERPAIDAILDEYGVPRG